MHKLRLGNIKFSFLIGLLFLLAFAFYATQPLISDVSFFIEADKRILNGAVPYVDIYETNPPFAFWMTIPPVWFAQYVGLPAETCFVLYALLIHAAVFGVLWRVLDGNEKRKDFLISTTIILLFGLSFGFGQREYFATIFVLPYLCMASKRDEKYRPSIPFDVIGGALLGLGLWFKPYFAAIPLCVEIYLILTKGSLNVLLRRQVIVAALVAALYPLIVWRLYPHYMSDIVPLAQLTYGAFEAPYSVILRTPTFVIFLMVFLICFGVLATKKFDDKTLWVWLSAGVGGLMVYVLQHKGWDYHFVPGLCFVLVGFLYCLDLVGNVRLKWLGISLLLIFSAMSLKFYSDSQDRAAAHYDVLLAGEKPKRMMVLSYAISDSFPYLPAHGIEWVGHFQSLWMLAAVDDKLMPKEPGDKIYDLVASTIADDLNHFQPDHVIVSRVVMPHQSLDEEFIKRLEQNALFSAAWDKYIFANNHNGYDVWVRR